MPLEWTEREWGGITRHVRLDEDGMFRERLSSDAEPVLERNKKLLIEDDGYSPSRDIRRVASVPMHVLEMWRVVDGIEWWNPNHAEFLRRKFNDPDWRWLRTAPGRV